MNKRVVIFIWQDWFHPQAGGAELYCKAVATILQEHNFDVHLVVCTINKKKETITVGGITIHRIASRLLIIWATFLWYQKHKTTIDLIIDFTNKIPYLTPLYVKQPIIAAFMHTNGVTFLDEWGMLGWLGIIGEQLLLLPYRKKPAIAISKSTQKELEGKGFNDVKVGIVPTFWSSVKQAKPASEPTIVIVSRLRKYKRIDRLLEALALLKQKGVIIRTIIIGSGPDQERLKQRARDLSLEQVVTWLGYAPNEKRDELMSHAWLTVTTSHKEGWGIVTTEAAQFAIPTIGVDAPGTRDAIVHKRTGILVPPDKLEVLAHAINELITDPRERRRLGQAAQLYAQSLTIEQLKDTWLTNIARCLK